MIHLPRLYAVAERAFGDPVRLAMELLEGGASSGPGAPQVRDVAYAD